MDFLKIAAIYKSGLNELETIIKKAELEALNIEESRSLVKNNINFFTKSFLISVCTHVEMFVKEIVYEIACDLDSRIIKADIPTSIIEWRYSHKNKSDQKSIKQNQFQIKMTKKEVDDLVSGNVYRTRDALALMGIDLSEDPELWESKKELIQAIVNKRNKIVHHNDSASDISFKDIRLYISEVRDYIDFIIAKCDK